MARVCIVFGLLLCGLTMGALILATHKNPALFVPMMVGIPILFCGVVGLNPHRLGTSVRFASGIAFAGAILGGSRIGVCSVRLGTDHHVNMFALKVVVVLTILCLVFAAICVFSILRNRRRRLAGAGVITAGVTDSSPPDSGNGLDGDAF